MTEEYFARIEAIEFAVHHDDGANVRTLYDADMVLTGVSRTSKTPLCMYLAQRGYKVGNVPLVPSIQPPRELMELDQKRVFGLIIDPAELTTIRQARLLAMNVLPTTDYTDIESVEVVDRVLSQEVNAEIVDLINATGGEAKGFAGTDIFTCKKHAPAGEDYGFVGEVTGVNTAPLMECIAQGITPVISPTACDADGQVYNCNADLAAAQAAIALAAKRLVFMTDVRGLLRDPNDDATLISHLDIAEVDELKQAGIIASGMIPKVDSAVTAINAGVDKVALVNGQIHHAVLLEIFTDKGVGTEIVK